MQRIESYPDPIFSGDTPSHRRGRGRRWLRRGAWTLLALIVLALVVPRATTWMLARGDVEHRASDLPALTSDEHLAAIVLGAGLVGERPSAILDDRIEAATKLLEANRVDLLLMSGDNTTEYYDEPTVMRRRAIELGARADQVAADYAGRRTWDTCMRARTVFGIERAVVVTSAFHVDRAIATCRAAGIDVVGLSVDDGEFRTTSRVRWRMRELAATGRALVDAWVLRPEPAVGGDAIDPWDACQLSDSLAPSDAASDDELTSRCG
ncbi:MAG: hypothetical protein JWM90_1400 [Thermoleophilia bacterium]|nr:hypothetical protein [Thermoleophilia bacterium]